MDFVESFEILHYSFLSKKLSEVAFEEFELYYKIVSFLTNDESKFINVVSHEWNKLLNVPSQKIASHLLDEKSNNNTKSKNQNNNGRQYDNHQRSADNKTPQPKEAAKVVIKDALSELVQKIRSRGIRGLMSLHKQLLVSNRQELTFNELEYILKLQRFNLESKGLLQIVDKYFKENAINIHTFIGIFKKKLSPKRLKIVQNAFNSLDRDNYGEISLDTIKLSFCYYNHPEVLNHLKTEEDILMEFFDTFEQNYNFLAEDISDSKSSNVSEAEFINYYEYISFLYDEDTYFSSVVNSTWGI